MPPPIGLSKSKLLSFLQCPRRLWLETYSPELEESEDTADRATGRVVGDLARRLYGRRDGHRVTFERGLRGAIESTRALLAAGGTEPIFEATLEHDGVVAQIDVLDRSDAAPRIVEVKSSTRVKPHHLADCAIQTWIAREAGLPVRQVAVANVDSDFVYRGDERYDGLLRETDVTADVEEQLDALPALVARARATLEALDEPDRSIGLHCDAPHACPFFAHCAPPQGQYPVTGLGGSREKQYALIGAGYRDLRDLPEAEIADDMQRRIWQQTRLETPRIDATLASDLRSLGFPRYYLDFETVGFAVPIWANTRPYEALPFQWSCHVDPGEGDAGAETPSAVDAEPDTAERRSTGLRHLQFLDLSGQAPMRAAAESLIAALGTAGPILVYTAYESRVLKDLAARCPDLAAPLDAIRERIVDLHPWVKRHYYHPAMLGSWSLKAVLPTVAPHLAYDESLGEVRDGLAAQAAYLEAIDPGTTAQRRAALDRALRSYCRQDTLALVELVRFFSGPGSD